jgi:RES domain-containing protein
VRVVSAWRVSRVKFAEPPYNPFDGEGARSLGGRWNSPGIAVVYASGSLSLAVLEILVHADSLSVLPDHIAFPLDIPQPLIHELGLDELPDAWNDPSAPADLRRIGDEWARARRTVALRVPSAVIPSEFNFVLNPAHPEFERVAIGDRQKLEIDPRLLKS